MTDRDDGFLSRWARRKAQARQGIVDANAPEAPVVAPAGALSAGRDAPVMPPATDRAAPVRAPRPGPVEGAVPAVSIDTASAAPAASAVPLPEAPPLPTLADVALLTRDSDYSRFMKPGVEASVKNAAMKKLFSDPHFNVMDGLDTYIGDYSQSDPIPLAMLRQMNQSKALGLFDDETADDEAADARTADAPTTDMETAANEALGTETLDSETFDTGTADGHEADSKTADDKPEDGPGEDPAAAGARRTGPILGSGFNADPPVDLYTPADDGASGSPAAPPAGRALPEALVADRRNAVGPQAGGAAADITRSVSDPVPARVPKLPRLP